MCPACFATAALMVAGATSASGLTAFVAHTLRARSGSKGIDPNTQPGGEQHEPSESRVAG